MSNSECPLDLHVLWVAITWRQTGEMKVKGESKASIDSVSKYWREWKGKRKGRAPTRRELSIYNMRCSFTASGNLTEGLLLPPLRHHEGAR